MPSKTAVVVITDGTEESEAVIIIDILRRAGITVTVASLNYGAKATCCKGTILQADTTLKEIQYILHDALIIPEALELEHNGLVPFSKELSVSPEMNMALKTHQQAGNIIAAVGAAPEVFEAHGIAKYKRITCNPCIENKMIDYYVCYDKKVVRDGNVVTCRGVGAVFQFALQLVEILVGREVSEKVRKEMCIPAT